MTPKIDLILTAEADNEQYSLAQSLMADASIAHIYILVHDKETQLPFTSEKCVALPVDALPGTNFLRTVAQ